jgi:hypothetical protein
MDTDKYFKEILQESLKDPELFILLNQKPIEETKSIFDFIKEDFIKKEDPKYCYGHMGILVNTDNKALAQKTFILPVIGIEVTLGRIVDINGKDGIRFVWKKA